MKFPPSPPVMHLGITAGLKAASEQEQEQRCKNGINVNEQKFTDEIVKNENSSPVYDNSTLFLTHLCHIFSFCCTIDALHNLNFRN